MPSTAPSSESQPVLAALPQWPALRTMRDTLTLSPEWVGRGEEAYALLFQLSAYGTAQHRSWGAMPETPPGVPPTTEDGAGNAVPRRAQLLHAIAQCNAFTSRLPPDVEEPESEEEHASKAWLGGLLWPLLGRMTSAGDRERLFDDEAPLQYVPAYFPAGALMNHSCAPNASFAGCGWGVGEACPTLRMTALVDIAQGEEVTTAYGYVGEDARGVEERRYKLLLTYRFACACRACVEEEPRAGTLDDPLRAHFTQGAGLDGQLAFYGMGGKYPAS